MQNQDNFHLSTHHDKIWSSGCAQKEQDIYNILHNANSSALVRLVDSLHDHELQQPCIVTDNVLIGSDAVPPNLIPLAPEFWHIYAMHAPSEHVVEPIKKFNCLMNRLSGERLMMLYKLAERNLLDQGIVSFNCLYHDRDPSVQQRKDNFANMHLECKFDRWDHVYQQLKDRVPILLDYNDPDVVIQQTRVTVVVETYMSDCVIAFSEKTFRSLQTARPWLLFGSAGSVAVLRKYGFDVLDDLVNHDYDDIVDHESRMDRVLDQIDKIQTDIPRCRSAARNNNQLLRQLADQWPSCLAKALQSISQ